MQIWGKKKPNDDLDDGNSDDEKSDTEELETYDEFSDINTESQVKVVTPKPRDTDSLVIASDILSVTQSITSI